MNETTTTMGLDPDASITERVFMQIVPPVMTLRDWFAGQIIGAIIKDAYGTLWDEEKVSAGAYSLADAMLKERAK